MNTTQSLIIYYVAKTPVERNQLCIKMQVLSTGHYNMYMFKDNTQTNYMYATC